MPAAATGAESGDYRAFAPTLVTNAGTHSRRCREDVYTLDGVNGKAREKKKNKDAQLVLRLNGELRDEFIRACKDLDTTAAREIRRYIKRFLKRYEKGELDDLV